MPQEFQVLQCYSCQTFQVHQVKKAKKWACKMCGEKQSIIKVYGRGTGAECRQHVQTLNTHRGEMDLLMEALRCNEGFQEATNYPQYNDDDDDGFSINVQESGKWNQFVEKDPGNVENDDDDDDDFDDGQFTTDASLLNKRGKSRKRKGENPEFQRKPKAKRFNSFYDQSADDDQYNDSVTRAFTSQGCRWMDSSSDNYSVNVDEDQGDENNTMTKFGTKSNRDQSYKRQNTTHLGNINPHTTSKWSSFGEEIDQHTMEDHIVGVTAKPCNSSFNQAGVTRFCSNTDNIDYTETYMMKNKGQQKTSKWSSFGEDLGNQILDEPTESFTNGDRQAMSKWNAFEDHSSQQSSENDPTSQDDKETDTRIYVEFNLADQNPSPQSNHAIEMPKHKDIRTLNDRNTRGACNNLSNYHSNLNESANQISRYKGTVNQRSRNSKASTAKQTFSKWGQFLGGDSEEENYKESDHTSGHDISNSSTNKVDNFTNESVNVGRDVDDKVHVISGNRKVLGDMNVLLKGDLSKTLAYNRPVPRLNNGNSKISDLDSKSLKDCSLKVIQNKVDKSNAVVVNKTLDVNSLFSTGDFSDDDFEL